MTSPDKEKNPGQRKPTGTHQTTKEVTLSVVSTALSAVCFLLAFTYFRGTEQLMLVSLAGMLIGGAR
jgi:hypothetical protein